ncbi:MAG: hypothetical protein J1E64_04870 [Acetatifactor sp.]|nr:hypothetical protein [Acetatifactor sp.]
MSNKVLCGIVCDENTYNEFASKGYTVPHSIKDGDLTLEQIEFLPDATITKSIIRSLQRNVQKSLRAQREKSKPIMQPKTAERDLRL